MNSAERKIIDKDFAQHFAQQWVDGWNKHDIEKILEHYADNFVIETPLALKRLPETGGRIKGKGNVRAYWSKALEAFPGLRFKLINVCCGINSLAIYYTSNVANQQVIENMFFDEENKVEKAIVMYG